MTALVGIQRLLQLLLQNLIPALQLVHFRQKASEPQVEGFQDADVGSQVVSQSHGCGGMRHSAGLVVAAGVEVRGGL